MANFNIFSSKKTDTCNEAGGRAYTLSPEQQLAQLAATGCFNDTFYASAETQLEQILNVAQKIEPLFIAKTAIYARIIIGNACRTRCCLVRANIQPRH